MGSLRKFIASVSVFTLLFTIAGFNTIASAFVDVPSGAYYESALDWAVAEGVVDDADFFRPGDLMNRAEMAKMVVTALGVPMDTSAGPSFVDVAEGAWFYDDVETAVANGLVGGYTDADGIPSGLYGPGDNTTRGAVAKVLMLAYGFDTAECDTTFPDVDYSAWYGPYVDSACNYGVMTGDANGMARPGDAVLRAEFVTMLNRAATYVAPTEEPVVEEPVVDEPVVDVPASEGTLQIAVAPSSAMAANIPGDAASVGYSTFALTALGDDVTFNGATIWRDGLGSENDFSNVWFSVDGFKLGSERTLNTDDNAVLTLSRDFIVIPEGETVLLDLKASMGTNVGANRSNRLGFRSEADVDSNAAIVSGTFPMYGNYMTTSSYTVGNVVFSNDGSATTVDVGDVQVIVGEFQVENQSDNNEDFVLANVDIEINGSANFDSLANAQVYYLGEVVSNSVTPIDDHFRFTFNDGGFLLEDGDSEDFEIKADVIKGDDGDTIFGQLDDDNDFTVYVANTGYNYAVDVNRTNPTTGILSTYTINAGTFTFARHASSPSATEVTNDIDGVTFLVAQVTIGEDVKVKESRVYLDADLDTLANGSTAINTCSDGAGVTGQISSDGTINSTDPTVQTVLAAKLDDIKIWDGSRLAAGGSNNIADDGTVAASSLGCSVTDAWYSFTDNFDLTAGIHLLSVTGDISNNASASETFQLSFDNTPSGWLSVEYLVSGDDVATADMNGAATGSTFTVESATLTLSRQDGFPDNEDIVVGSDDIVLLTMKVENNDAGDVTITDMDIEGGGTVNVDGTLITGLGIYESGTDNMIVDNLTDLGSDDIVQFDGLDYVIPSGGFALFDVRGSISTSWAVSDDLDLFVTGMQANDVNNNSSTVVYPDCETASCSTLDALAFASFDVNSGAQVTIAFDARQDADYTDLEVPTGLCSDGSCAALVAQFEFHPLFDDVLLKMMVLSNNDGTVDYSQRFGTFFLVDELTGDVIDTGSLSDSGSDGTVTFDGFTYSIPKDAYYNLNVLAEIKNITRAEQTGAFTQLFLASPTTSTLQITSDATGTDIDVTDSTILVNNADNLDSYQQQHIARRTVPYVTYNNDEITSTINGTTSNKEVYKFTVTADEEGDIEWERLTFNVTETSGLTSSVFELYVEGQSNALNSAASLASGEVVINPTNIQSVPGGTSVTYVLKADISVGTPSASQTLSVELTAADDTTITTAASGALSTSDFVWSDRAAQSHSASSTDWTNGYEVDSFDIETVNIGHQGTG